MYNCKKNKIQTGLCGRGVRVILSIYAHGGGVENAKATDRVALKSGLARRGGSNNGVTDQVNWRN